MNPLDSIPFLGGYNAQTSLNQQRGMGQLQQVQGLMGMLQAVQAQQQKQKELARQEQYRSAMSALPPDADEETILRTARPFQGPDEIGRQVTASRDRKAQREAAALQFATKLEEAAAARTQKHEEFQQRQTDANARAAEMMAYRRDMMSLQQQNQAFQRSIAQQGIELRREGMDLRRQLGEQGKRPVEVKDEQGNVRLFDYSGNLVKDLGKVGAPSASVQKTEAEKRKTATNINEAIVELRKATADGGLIDKSTGSGAGAMIDMAAGFVGAATPGAMAVGEMQPIFDLVLKMVPRFEGPQSDKDTQTYREAAGQLANPNVPNPIKKKAGRTLLRLMEQRRNQFVSKDTPAEALPPSGGVKFLGFE